ncbi:MAG: 4-aminobutyrate--2-oxoglutarate transaminase [Steroidobacteraceae bacterium]
MNRSIPKTAAPAAIPEAKAGTTNAALRARREAAVPRGISTATPYFAARAEGAQIWDEEGRRFIDFAGGIAVLNTGHRHPRVIEAVERQMRCFTHTAFQVMAYRSYIELAERLNERAPFSGPAKSIFLTTGAEAVENAVKIARVATSRSGVISFTGAFHGRTALTSAMTGKVHPYKAMPGLPVPGVYHVPFPVEHYGVNVEDSIRALTHVFSSDLDPQQIAAMIIEPVQGEGGFHVAPFELLSTLRQICDRHGIVLIADEVQCGFGRTGKFFGIQHSGVEPDIVAVAKSLAGGFPLSGVIGRAQLMDSVQPGGLGGTYGGSPIGVAAALAVIEVIESEGLLERAKAIGRRLTERAQGFSTDSKLLPTGHVRGLGAMVAFDVLAGEGNRPDGAAAKGVTARAAERGLVVLNCGVYGEGIRLLVPLTASDDLISEGMDVLHSALELH